MLRRMLILTLAFLGTSALANPEKDAALFMSNFIDQSYWDYVERKSEQNKTRVYRRALLERNIVIVDKERFHDMIPESAADEAVQRLKSHVAAFIIESYGPDHLSHIADFFRQPFGEKMLLIAKDNHLFKKLHSQSPNGGPIDQWWDYLSLQERARFGAFGSTPAGQFFVKQTWAVRRALHYEIVEISRWPDPSLHRPYIVEILKTDGILKFPNPALRQSLIKELSVTNP